MLALTAVTGLVDAVSILSLGRVFVANMTGNVVFVGFALAGSPGFSLSASLSALAGFLVGAFGGGVLIARMGAHRGRLFRNTVAVELVFLAAALLVATAASTPYREWAQDTLAGLLAVAMGLQNAAARTLAVPDLTTTVLTMTLTGLAAELRARNWPVITRRVLAVVTMLGGAVGGALLVLHSHAYVALAVAAALLAVVAVLAWVATHRPAAWHS
jgi:uncharacterized membrane protein YoaK (UPF0700 family)